MKNKPVFSPPRGIPAARAAHAGALPLCVKLCLVFLVGLLCFWPLVGCGGPDGGKDMTSLSSGQGTLPSAGRLLRGLRAESCGIPPVLFFYGEKNYTERFEGLYHSAPEGLKDGAIALSDGNTADEVAIFLPLDEKGQKMLTQMLRDHVQEEISVYESYSPTDVAHLKNAQIYTEKGYVILIVSGSGEKIRQTLSDFLRDPSGLPGEDGGSSSGSLDSFDSSGDLPSGDFSGEDPSGEGGDSSGRSSGRPSELPSELPSGLPSEGSDSSEKVDPPPSPPAPTGAYVYQNDLPENGERPVEYLADALFIGDSRMEDLLTYLKPKNAGAYAYSSLSVSAVFTKNLVQRADGSRCTIAQALRETKPTFTKCYLCFGLNEIGWPYLEKFSAEYEKVIGLVRELNPDCTVYLMNIYPVTASHSAEMIAAGNEENNGEIRRFNDCIAGIAEKTHTHHLNLASAVCDETGALPEDAAGDGVHGNIHLCRKILAYMLTHTVR